ncbi:MAG: CPBP family intramembrane metalloprotease [Thermoguttaceae bacterium]|nr:CPBP family intramembrane metalloprotease [Thermoguttaceae bacterium]
MNSILINILSWWIPKRRYSLWHCNILELILAALLFMFLPSLTLIALYPSPSAREIRSQSNDSSTPSTEIVKQERPDEAHPVLRLVQTRNWTYIGLGFYMACILAPINEELLFRAGLQNCLQGILTQLFRKRLHINVKICNWLISVISITLPALFFALVHYRSQEMANESIESIIRTVTVACIAWTLFPIICYSYLFFVRRLRPRDMFGSWREAPRLAFYGVKWIWIIVPTYILAFILLFIRLLTGAHFIPDPICLIPLALVFGFLYYRTQSVLPSIVLHILFNFTSLSMALMTLLL